MDTVHGQDNNDNNDNSDNDIDSDLSTTMDSAEDSAADHESTMQDIIYDSDGNELPDVEGDVNHSSDEALEYLKGLIRDHLMTAMEDDQALKHFVEQPADDKAREFMIQMIIIALEADHDIMLAYLLKAALEARETATGDLLETIDEFLRRTYDVFEGVGAIESRDYVQSVLEYLLRKEESDSEATASAVSSTPETGSSITVSFGDEMLTVAFHDILNFFWGTKFNSKCHHCHEDFAKNEPPIRTITKHEVSSIQGEVHIRVINRHLSCVKTIGVFFVPVSHVWDDSIRRANVSGVHEEAAASTLVKTLKDLFIGAEESYSPGVEFWHDYFSVPQWVPATKHCLLLHIPAIYHLVDEILVHMSDVPSSHVWLLLIWSRVQGEITLVQALQKVHIFRCLCESEWMKRMWVTLEYAQSKAACVMDKSAYIHRTLDANGLFARDTFSQLVSGTHNQLLSVFRYAKTFAKSLSLPGDFLGGLANRTDGPRQLCLGEAVEMIAKKDCFLFRDRFIAIQILTDKQVIENNVRALPLEEVEACEQVWKNALMNNDYSPLLLQPQERVVGSNPTMGLPSFLVGCHTFDGADWTLGDLRSSPKRPIISIDPIVQLELDVVGLIERIDYMGVQDSGEIAGVDWAIQYLFSAAAAEEIPLSPEKLVDSMNRVFPFDMIHQQAARVLVNMVFKFEECQERDNNFQTRLKEQLEIYGAASVGEEGSLQRRNAAEEISKALELERHILGEISDQITRLTRSRHVARRRKERGVELGEAICQVRCLTCRCVTLFRLDLRDTADLGHKVFRIPGLSYSEGVENGIGLVVGDGRITGRMFYGPPACDCRFSEIVEIN
ncbi:hypothetical protein GLAREA_11907 [Glarea lozoyensis ATCC 20868]|uniref:Uncharacterized protein n=1 Tax=Glarea lozoyensis (strain ATCC 20868 / MF5171) TaxID=1116229 RepID=S3D206_GLAL2|nr:uncharacterized protein GLAREA_11907 [Glarea lozoyensis ATCC 20868]EPE31825.1 hypothetical protein GLAREA_11907 [Glarea lozoyensis ATCC 20868]